MPVWCRLDYDTVHALLDKFCTLANLSEDGSHVTIETFSQYMGLPITTTLTQLFNLFDRVWLSPFYSRILQNRAWRC